MAAIELRIIFVVDNFLLYAKLSVIVSALILDAHRRSLQGRHNFPKVYWPEIWLVLFLYCFKASLIRLLEKDSRVLLFHRSCRDEHSTSCIRFVPF